MTKERLPLRDAFLKSNYVLYLLFIILPLLRHLRTYKSVEDKRALLPTQDVSKCAQQEVCNSTEIDLINQNAPYCAFEL